MGEPLVLLHGVGESAAGWRPVQEALSRVYDVIALDFPGFGGSAKLPANALPSAVALADAKLTRQDARQLLLNFASAPAYEETVLATMVDIPTGLDRITCPVLIMQGTADPLISMQSPRFLTFIPHAQFRWLYGLSHVPISDDPELVTRLMLDFLSTAAEGRVLRESLPAPM